MKYDQVRRHRAPVETWRVRSWVQSVPGGALVPLYLGADGGEDETPHDFTARAEAVRVWGAADLPWRSNGELVKVRKHPRPERLGVSVRCSKERQ